jgi:Flp pilus assembly protein TadD
VDNLGMSYGISGNLPKAKEVFESAVRDDPTYPLFHYNLACAAAETNDFDEALEQLKIAFQDRANGNPGEGMPDPAKDDSFKRYLNDPRFRELSKQVCPTSRRSESGWMCIP